jgi:hypothetical protein
MAIERKSTPQPTMRPVTLPPSKRRGGGYGKDLHDTAGEGWLHGGRGEDHPNFDPGHKGKQKKLRPKWPY